MRTGKIVGLPGSFVSGGLVIALFVAGALLPARAEDLTAAAAAAQKSLEQAQAAEKDAFDARYSLDMARAATGAIVTAALETKARGEKALQEVRELLRQANEEAATVSAEFARETDAAKKSALQEQLNQLAAEQAELQQLIAARIERLGVYQQQLTKDEGVAARAAASYFASERKYEEAILATWEATRGVQTVAAAQARAMLEQAVAERTAAERLLAEKTAAAQGAAVRAEQEPNAEAKRTLAEAAQAAAAERAAAEQTLAAKAAAAQTAADASRAAEHTLHETEVAAAWDAHHRAVTELARAEQTAREKAGAAQALTGQANAEADPAKKQELSAAAARAAAEQAAADQAVAQQRAAVAEGGRRVAALRVTALGGLKPLAPEAWDYAKARHLLVRAGFGGTPQQVQKLCELGLDGAVDYLVRFDQHAFAAVPFDAVPPPAADPLAEKLRIPGARERVAASAARAGAYGAQQGRLVDWWLRRMVESPRPLQEKLTLFWHGHFATQASVVGHSFATYHHNQLLREHAAGNFGALLYGIVHDPVMIRYLDNNSNVRGHANENLAREIMELFAMGVNQGYAETDIREAARALTGYTFEPRYGQFHYVGANHDETPKKIFGREGNWTGDDLVQLILEQPATSRFVARKLWEFFVQQDPSDEPVEQLAALLRAHHYELTPVLENLFRSEAFYSPEVTGAQIKCPVQLVVGTLRTLGVEKVADAGLLHQATTAMGQQLLEPPDVKGWRYGQPWVNSNRIFVRYNSVADVVRSVPLADGRRGIDLVAVVRTGGCCTPDEIVDYLIRACYGTPLAADKRDKLLAVARELPPADEWDRQRDAVNAKLQDLLVLLTSTPEYQVN